MHGAAQWACFMLMAQGATLIFPDETRRVDPDDVWSVVEREKANSMTIVGDAVLRPLLLQLDKKNYDLSVVLRRRQRRRAADAGRAGDGGRAHPQPRHLRLGRLLGDRGTDARDLHGRRGGGLVPARSGHRGGRRDAVARARAGARGQRVAGPDGERAARVSRRPREDGAHLPRDRRRPLLHPRRPGAAPGRRADRAARARLGDGQLGRREDLRRGGRAGHRRPPRRGRRRRDRPARRSAGATRWWPSCSWPRARPTDGASVVEHASAHIARYKLPKEVVFVEQIQRSPSGKADYRWAAETAVQGRPGA